LSTVEPAFFAGPRDCIMSLEMVLLL